MLKNKFKSKKYFKKHSRLGYLPVVQRTGSLGEFGGNNSSGDFPVSPSLSPGRTNVFSGTSGSKQDVGERYTNLRFYPFNCSKGLNNTKTKNNIPNVLLPYF